MQKVKIKQVHFAPRFFKSFEKLPRSIQELTMKKDKLFRENPFDTRLHTHKLKGELAGTLSYYVNRTYRVLFRFIKTDEVLYYDIETHEVYR